MMPINFPEQSSFTESKNKELKVADFRNMSHTSGKNYMKTSKRKQHNLVLKNV